MDSEPFLTAANKNKNTIYRVALNYMRNTYDAEDVVQNVLMKLYCCNTQFKSDDHIRYWLIRVTVNQCKNELRVPWRKRNVVLDELSESFSFEQREQRELFMSVMGLPENHRIVLYLFYYEGFSAREIAEILKLKESAVTTRLLRARGQLKTQLVGEVT